MALSETLQNNLVHPLPLPPSWGMECFWYQGGLFGEVEFGKIAHLTARDLLAGPYVFRFDLQVARVYFAEDEALFLKFQDEGKEVRWLHDLFEGWRKELIRQGLPPYTSIYWWRLEDVHFYLTTLQVFPGAKVVYQGPVGGWEGKL